MSEQSSNSWGQTREGREKLYSESFERGQEQENLGRVCDKVKPAEDERSLAYRLETHEWYIYR